MAQKKNIVVPIFIDRQDLSLRNFAPSRYQHVSNSQRDKLLRLGVIEILDLPSKVYRLLTRTAGFGYFIASSANGSGAVSKDPEIPQSIRQLLVSEITRMPYREVQI